MQAGFKRLLIPVPGALGVIRTVLRPVHDAAIQRDQIASEITQIRFAVSAVGIGAHGQTATQEVGGSGEALHDHKSRAAFAHCSDEVQPAKDFHQSGSPERSRHDLSSISLLFPEHARTS